ncbi:hypothetical protein HK098_002232 [Nowakowskiella sp. JEL0407]|nr:hypothetical protein HK098_002232 [Nowakowskiella sp. JEL0407]
MVMKALERLNLFIAELSAHILNSNKSETKKNWTKKQLFADYEESHFDFHASEGNTIIPTEFTVQIFHSFSAEQSAYWIRYSGEIAADDCETPRVISGNDQTPAWKSRHSWENRDWLNREEVNQERFLCSFGAFNTINAQIVLKLSHSLYNLMNISLEDMIEAFSLWVSKQSLIDFYRKIHSTTNDDISVTRNVWA